MKRTIRWCLLIAVLSVMTFATAKAQSYESIAGTIGPDSVMVLTKHNKIYQLNNELVVEGTLIVEPGTEIQFLANGRIRVAAGGRLIADGFAQLEAKDNLFEPNVGSYPYQYADMGFFLYDGGNGKTAGLNSTEMGARERTIHPAKYNHIFNVALDTANRKLVNIADPYNTGAGGWPASTASADNTGAFTGYTYVSRSSNPNLVVIPFETALLFMAANLHQDPNVYLGAYRTDRWDRGSGISPSIAPQQILFRGIPQQGETHEWGHIVVMPGARAAFFRNCQFLDIKKDTTVDNRAYYSNDDLRHTLESAQLAALNKRMTELANGGGGAITTFSSRTWILNCVFNKNTARTRGGALQILQTPTSAFYPNGVVVSDDTTRIGRFDFRNNPKNFKVSDPDKHYSTVLTRHSARYPRYPKIDAIDEAAAEYWTSDKNRMAWDDARLAGYLGRFRNLEFNTNLVQIANIIKDSTSLGEIVRDDTLRMANFPQNYGDMAHGGAIYVAGTEDVTTEIEFAFGLNDAIWLGNGYQNPNNIGGCTNCGDYIKFSNNIARNMQRHPNSGGAKGGAIYAGSNTSIIVAGEFEGNFTDARLLVDMTGRGQYNPSQGQPTPYINGLLYSAGGAIFSNPNYGRLQIRGRGERDEMSTHNTDYVSRRTVSNATTFKNNSAGAGGAVYVAESRDVLMSPYIGGSDVNIELNRFGERISFENNYAYSAGGAVFAKRNMEIFGAGGERRNFLNYIYPNMVMFNSNEAAFAGGAVHIEIPTGLGTAESSNTRIANIRRAEFLNNNVGSKAYNDANNVNNQIREEIRGGGAVYALWTDLNVIRAVNFDGNEVYNGNGAAIAMINPFSTTRRLFVTDLDVIKYAPLSSSAREEGASPVAIGYTSINNPFTFGTNYPTENWIDGTGSQASLPNNISALRGMLTRFSNNKAIVARTLGQEQIREYGATQFGEGYIMPRANIYTQWWFNPTSGAPTSGFVAGSGGHLIKVTRNAGNEWIWENIKVDTTGDYHDFTTIYFVNADIGYLANSKGDIFRTTNAGNNWDRVYFDQLEFAESINSLAFNASSTTGVAVTSRGRILTTTTGTSWTILTTIDEQSFNDIFWVGNSLFVVGSNGTIRKSIDSGSTWEPLFVPGVGIDAVLNRVYFLGQNLGLIIGSAGRVLRTENGGEEWSIITTGPFANTENLTSIYFRGINDGYIVSDRGNVYRTTDGGVTWTLASTFPNGLYTVQMFSNSNDVYVGGNNDLLQGTNNNGTSWTSLEPSRQSGPLGSLRQHGGVAGLYENGIGLGGAIYILDFRNQDAYARKDSIYFNRVRMINNFAFTGSVIYSDNFDMKLIFNRSLIRGNTTDSVNTLGRTQNAITGSYTPTPENLNFINYASSDLAAATIYGEVQGPLPTNLFNTTANSMFENEARFLIRLPDAPNTKGIMATGTNVGAGGVDTLIGNYWGKTEANVILTILNLHEGPGSGPVGNTNMSTFFVASQTTLNENYSPRNYLPFFHNIDTNRADDLIKQGPFEFNMSEYSTMGHNLYTYKNIEIGNAPASGGQEPQTQARVNTIPEQYLFSFGIYDLHDKGNNIKTADYSRRRMVPIEDFAVGNPIILRTFADTNDLRPDLSKKTKYVRRWVQNPQFANAYDATTGDPIHPALNRMQSEWKPMMPYQGELNVDVPKYYHPLGMPIYLEAEVDFSGLDDQTNWDYRHQASTVFFVINETTTDYIRVEFKQVAKNTDNRDSIWADPLFRANVFLVPDSTDRNGDHSRRRTNEGLLNMGSNGTFPFAGEGNNDLLRNLCPRDILPDQTIRGVQNAAWREDNSALAGRKYSVTSRTIGGRTDYRLGNLPTSLDGHPLELFANANMPQDNHSTTSVADYTNTFFAGERYGALPVNIGDVVRVVSRTVLWKDGVDAAYNGAITFIIRESIEAPAFTGDIVMFATDSLNPYITNRDGTYPTTHQIRPGQDNSIGTDTIINRNLLNKVFVGTNRDYPAPAGRYSNLTNPSLRGVDDILNITAVDNNGFNNPLVYLDPNANNTALKYTWEIIEPNAGLNYWLMADTVYTNTANPQKDDATGYLYLKGTPLNPYIVPGGERVRITVSNFAPGTDIIDILKEGNRSDDEIKMFYQTFPRYLNAPIYDHETARYLQQDSIAMKNRTTGGNGAGLREITIFVMDSLPRFIAYNAPASSFRVKRNTGNNNETDLVPYRQTEYQAGVTTGATRGEKVIANLTTNGLRFRVDINTDDEIEDETALAKGWDFRYGRTAYSFAHRTISASQDDVIMDTIVGGISPDVEYSQYRPSWMRPEYFVKYGDVAIADSFMADFTIAGQMNIKINRNEALDLLRSKNPSLPADRRVYNYDTAMAVVASDGHGGKSVQLYNLYVNFQPEFITETLIDATEGVEYNPTLGTTLADFAKSIVVYDANEDQRCTYELLYANDPRNTMFLDEDFDQLDGVAAVNLLPLKTTPTWLSINSQSGMLTGVPLVRDIADTMARVTVIITDDDGLKNIKTFNLKVNLNNAPPRIIASPALSCFENGRSIDEPFKIYDRDLLRTGVNSESVTITVDKPGFSIVPATINGPSRDTMEARLVNANFTYSANDLDQYGRYPLKITVRDRAGATDSITYYVRVSQPTDFISRVKVQNRLGHHQILEWGAAPNATVGDGSDRMGLDAQYCEIEVPPIVNSDVFDGRWDISSTDGTYRNIFPRTTGGNRVAYKADFIAGGLNATSPHYPVSIIWNPTDIGLGATNPASVWKLQDNLSNGNFFSVNMRDVGDRSITGGSGNLITFEEIRADSVMLTIHNTTMRGFHIVFNPNGDVEDIEDMPESRLVGIYPQPAMQGIDEVAVRFDIQRAGNVSIELFDVLGNKVASILDEYYHSGTDHVVKFNLRDMKGSRLSTGTYTVRMKTGTKLSQIQLIVVN